MEAREARAEFQKGRLTVEQLLDVVERQERMIQRLLGEVSRLRDRLAKYEPEVLREGSPGKSSDAGDGSQGDSAAPGSARYSVEAEEKRRRRRKRKKKSPGRRPTQLKFADAHRQQDIYPQRVPRDACRLVRERAVWRLEKGRATLVGYRVFAGPNGREPRIPGVTRRCEYGLEILVVLAFLVYVIGISLDKACAVLSFFCQLPLAKSQADALLRQLAQHWEKEFNTLCSLIARAAVVYMDETGWKIGREGCSLWTFAAQLQRVFLFGCRKDANTLDAMLPPEVFDGVAVSDDAAVYRDRFGRAQKCWAHLLRKAIKLALLYPRKKTYQRFLDQLLALYYDAKRTAADKRLGEAGRQHRVAELEGRLCALCHPYWRETTSAMKPHERDFANLVNELLRCVMDEELFTFVLLPHVDPTNNLAERLQRSPAQDRQAGRTSKTAAGAHRRSILVSVLESLRVNLESFTLANVLKEVTGWMRTGTSLFAKAWADLTRKASIATLNTS
jgi:transposase